MAGVADLNSEIARRKKEHVISGFLDLRGSRITKLPDNLTVRGNLYLSNNTGITALPENLTVNGSLYISGTAITTLPDTLTVDGSINLRDTGITAMPGKLVIGGSVYGLEENKKRMGNEGESERIQALMRQCLEEVKEEWRVFYNICLQDQQKDPRLKVQHAPLVFMIEKFAGVVQECICEKYSSILSAPTSFWGMIFSAVSDSKTCPEEDVKAALKVISNKYVA